jgi:hypothetical protein
MASRADLRREKGLKTDSLSQGVSLAGAAEGAARGSGTV